MSRLDADRAGPPSDSVELDNLPVSSTSSTFLNDASSHPLPSPRRRASLDERGRAESEEGDEVAYEDEDEAAFMLGPISGRDPEVAGEEEEGAGEEEDLEKRAAWRKRQRRRRRRGGAGAGPVNEDDPLEVIANIVPETDDPSLPSLTFRVFLIGVTLCIVGAAVTQLFFFKSNAPRFSGYFIILVSFPIGRWLARVLPAKDVRIALGKLTLFEFNLNPGPFSPKEHLLITVLASSGATTAYASDIIAIQDLYYHQTLSTVAGITLLLTTQVIGFGLANIVSDLLVKPPRMLFPSSLVTVTLFQTLHDTQSALTRPRLRFFMFGFIAIFLYQFLPSLIAPTLTSIAVLCIVDNKSPVMTVLSSGYKGFGFLNFSLDWTAVGSSGPLFTPWWASLNFFVGGIIPMMWIIVPALWFSNFWNAQSFPSPLDSGLFNSSYGHFEVASVLDKETLTLDETKWEHAKPLQLTPFFAISYGVSFAILTSVISHVLLWHWADLKRAIFSKAEHDDIHNVLMSAYPPVPKTWYRVTFALSLASSVLLCLFAPLQLPIWGLFLALVIAVAFLPLTGIVVAVSNTTIGLNVITEFVAGFLLPGRPIANVVFKCFGYMAMSQALDLVKDLKLGHYMKIPPRHMFITQIVGTGIGCVINYTVLYSVMKSKRPYLDGTMTDPTGQWTGRGVAIFYSASVIWGAVGPARFFTGKYKVLYIGFLVGLILPLLPWWLHKRMPGRGFDKVAWPLIFHGSISAPQTPTNIITLGFLTAWASQKWAKEKHPRWYEKYNYVLSAALDAGTSINALAVYVLSVTLLAGWKGGDWWWNSSMDTEHCKPGS